ncbi:MAG: hypothetical protein ACRC8Y_01320 [Chroococcales cyanobacterium]
MNVESVDYQYRIPDEWPLGGDPTLTLPKTSGRGPEVVFIPNLVVKGARSPFKTQFNISQIQDKFG